MLEFLDYRLNLTTLILVICTSISIMFQLIYYITCLYNFKKKEHKQVTKLPIQGVSVVLVTNNNAEALKQSLLQILEQDYPSFEVVVVNENSTDDTEFVLYVLKNNYPNLTVINLGKNDNNFDSYKFSLAIGIRSAKYSYCLLTDVSCIPQSYNWINRMMRVVNEDLDKKIVTGIVQREMSKSSLLNAIIKYDEVRDCINLIGYTNLGNAYTSCGMNMIYEKNFFISKGGFIDQYSRSCKQEDYFVHRYADKLNTSTVPVKDAKLLLPAIDSFQTFCRIKFATSLSHKVLAIKDKILLALNPFMSFLFYILMSLLLFFAFPWQYILFFIVVKWILDIIVVKQCMNKLDVKKIYWVSPLLEIFFFFFNFIIRIRVLFYRKKEKKIRWNK